MDRPEVTDSQDHPDGRPTAVIVHLSGRSRGTTRRLQGERIRIGVDRGAEVPLASGEVPGEGHRGATLVRRGETYELTAAEGTSIWVNGKRAERTVLASGDVLEIGQEGPVLRFRLYAPGSHAYKSMAEAFSDCVACAVHGADSLVQRAGILLTGVPRELFTQTSPLLRTGLLASLLVLLAGIMGLWTSNRELQRRLEVEAARVEALADLVERAEQETFTAEDFEAARAGMESRLNDALARVEALEAHAGAPARVFAIAAPSVVFIQGAYGFADAATGEPLRYAGTGPDGNPLRGRDGQPVAGLGGSGPVVEILYTGTAFVATDDGYLLTNRHVAVPWAYDASAQALIRQGLSPTMRRFIGYLPGKREPFDVELVTASDNADVALLRCSVITSGFPALPMTELQPDVGDEVIVLGYPAGIRALMARAPAAFVRDVRGRGPLDFWTVARELAAAGHIEPLATLGIVGQVTSGSVVYDAETTHGGSGGPVLGLDGSVVAVNAAIVPEFGGSNLGVPATEARRLLRMAEGQS